MDGAAADNAVQRVNALVVRARRAQSAFSSCSQAEIDLACLAAARPLMRENDNRRLSEMAVAETGLGNAADKQRKNLRKTLGLLRDIRGEKSVGIVGNDKARGLIEIARPVGVVAALTPSTNPVATPVNKTVNALKSGNAVVLAPPPAGAGVGGELLALIRAELKHVGAPPDLVQMLLPPSKAATMELVKQADFAVVTGSQRNVRATVASGTPAVGVGVGNVAVIVDETADIDDAAAKIRRSKTFDNATSCSSENHVILVADIYDKMMDALKREGGVLLSAQDKQQLQTRLWQSGALNRDMIARDMAIVAARAGLPVLARATFAMVEENNVGTDYPFSGEKLSLVLSVYRAKDFAAAKQRAGELLAHQGGGHSLGIHTQTEDRPLALGLELPACRIIVNQAHCFATGGSFDNAMSFSLSMGCGTWGKNGISDNLNFRHFSNTVRIVRPIPAHEPTIEEIYADYPTADK